MLVGSPAPRVGIGVGGGEVIEQEAILQGGVTILGWFWQDVRVTIV